MHVWALSHKLVLNVFHTECATSLHVRVGTITLTSMYTASMIARSLGANVRVIVLMCTYTYGHDHA